MPPRSLARRGNQLPGGTGSSGMRNAGHRLSEWRARRNRRAWPHRLARAGCERNGGGHRGCRRHRPEPLPKRRARALLSRENGGCLHGRFRPLGLEPPTQRGRRVSAVVARVIRRYDELAALEPAWWALWRRSPAATPFESPAWLMAWWRHFSPG